MQGSPGSRPELPPRRHTSLEQSPWLRGSSGGSFSPALSALGGDNQWLVPRRHWSPQWPIPLPPPVTTQTLSLSDTSLPASDI